MIKMLNKLGIKETGINIIKAIYDNPTANFTPSGESFFSNIGNEVRMPTRLTPVTVLRVPAREIRQEEK